jgi:hypothetical protein
MLLFLGDGVFDYSMTSLNRLLTMVDTRFAEIEEQLQAVTAEHPLHEEGDDLIGFAFVACQRYITEIKNDLRLDTGVALAVGPVSSGGQTVARVVSSAANAWKHEAEWDLVVETAPADASGMHRILNVSIAPPPSGARTVRELMDAVSNESWDYKFAAALRLLTPTMRFAAVATLLEAWRDAMIAKSREDT